MQNSTPAYLRGFVPYALAAFLIGIVGGFSSVLGPSFVQDVGIAYNNTTWTALAQAMSTAACAPILGKLGDVVGGRTTLLLGIAIIGMEAGSIYLYKVGWAVNAGQLVCSALIAVALIFVGYFLYKEHITWNKVVGIAVIMVGLFFINKK